MKVPSIPAKKFSEQVDLDPDAYILVDVRDDWEFNDDPMVKERISVYDMPRNLKVFKKYENKKIVLCCLNGERGNIAAKFLTSKGFENVYNLQGGFEALKEIGEFQK